MRITFIYVIFLLLVVGCDASVEGDNPIPDADIQSQDSSEPDITGDMMEEPDGCTGPNCDQEDTKDKIEDVTPTESDVLEEWDTLDEGSPDTSPDSISMEDITIEGDSETEPEGDSQEETDTEETQEDAVSFEDTTEDETCTEQWDWLSLPVRVALLSSEEDDLTTTLTEEEIPALIEHTNGIWSQACIRFEIESISTVASTADGEEAYLDAVENPVSGAMLSAMQVVMPEEELLDIGWNIVVIKTFGIPANGVYSKETDTVFFAQGKKPAKPTHPTILAHELGHSLGLPHYNGENVELNLMHSGGSGDPETSIELTEDQMNTARGVAETGDAH